MNPSDKSTYRLLRPNHNCWRIERATRLAFLVDGADYFAAVRTALARARHFFCILGWDVDSRMRLVPEGADDGYPQLLGEFLNELVLQRKSLHGYVLGWDYAMLFALEREWLPLYTWDTGTHRRLAFRLDDRHPVGASHHQKVVVIDDEIALIGGFDLAGKRWDTSEHACDSPLRRDALGMSYAPYHDVGTIVSGPCARALGELCRARWRRAGGQDLPAPPRCELSTDDAWPPAVRPELTDVDVAIARTEPKYEGRNAVNELRHLHLDAIASADRSIIAENQYFTSPEIADAFAHRLAAVDGPEIALVMPANQSGWLEASTMGVLRARLHRQLREADVADRYRLYCPARACDGVDATCINVHSKVLIIDDELLTLGSANLSNRSLCLDTECNIALEAAGNDSIRQAIAGLRDRLLGEHLDAGRDEVGEAIRSHRSLHAAIASFQRPRQRWLDRREPELDPAIDAITPTHDVLDPECPLDPELLISDLLPERHRREAVRLRVLAIGLSIVALAGLAIAWRYTALASYLNVEFLSAQTARLRDSGWAPWMLPVVYVVAGVLMVPVTLLIAVTIAVFGPFVGIAYAFVGAMTSALAAYALGRFLGRNTVRRIAGKRLNELSRRLGKRGLLAMLLVRMIPVAPYAVVNLVAGASHIGWRDYLLGTALGLMPGLVMTTAFVDRAIAAFRSPGADTFATLGVVLAGVLMTGWFIQRRFLGVGRDRGSESVTAMTDAG